MVLFMIGEELPRILNEILGDVTGDEYSDAQSVVEAADTVQDAVEAAGILDLLESDEGRAEAYAVLNAMPQVVDEAIIAALENAFERQAPVEVEWVRSANEIEVRISEKPYLGGQRIHIAFVSPPGETFPR